MAKKLLTMITAVFVALQCLPVSVSAENADTEISNESLKKIPVKTVIHHEEQTAETEEERSSEGTAYAIYTADKELIFFRSNNTYENNTETTAEDILGNSYTGVVYSGIESMSVTLDRNIPWHYKDINSTRVADGQLIKPVMTAYWFSHLNLTDVDLRGLDTSAVTDMSSMFASMGSCVSLDLRCLNTENVTNMSSMFGNSSSITDLNLTGWNTSNVTNMRFMFGYCSGLTELDLSPLDTSNVTDMSGLFSGCSSLASLDLSGFDTSKTTNMEGMFSGCRNLKNIDLSPLDTSNVTDMSGMFSGCSGLTAIDLSPLKTDKVTDMSTMFSSCTQLENIDLSVFDTGSVTDMKWMFNSCSKLSEIDLSSFDTSKVTDMSNMFALSGVTHLSFDGLDLSNVENIETMFYSCPQLVSVDLSDHDLSKAKDTHWMFAYCHKLESVDLSNTDLSGVTKMNEMFKGSENLANVNLSNIDTSGTSAMREMFRDCSSLIELDLSSLDTENVTDMYMMLYGCNGLTHLNLSGLKTGNVKNMYNLFGKCSALTEIDLSSFDTGNATDMSYMFAFCSGLSDLHLKSLDTSSATNLGGMFIGCTGLSDLDLSGFDTSSATELAGMFQECTALTEIDFSSFDFSNVKRMDMMFKDCSALTGMDLSGKDLSKVTSVYGLFDSCPNLVTVNLSNTNLSNVENMSNMFYKCSRLSEVDFSNNRVKNVTNLSYMFDGCSSLVDLDLSCFDTSKVQNMSQMFSYDSVLGKIYVSELWNTENVISSSSMFYNCISLPNFTSEYVDKTNAHYGEGGYLTYKEYIEPEDPVVREIRFTDSSLEVKVNEELMISGNYNGPDYDSLEIIPSDPSAFELTSSSVTPLGEEYLFIFNLKALKAGEYTLGVTDGYITESIPVSVEDIPHEDPSILWFEKDSYESTVYEPLNLTAYYAGEYPENLKVSSDDEDSGKSFDITWKKNADGIYEISLMGKMRTVGIHYVLLENGCVYAKANIKVNPKEGEGFTLGRDNNSFPPGQLDDGAGGFNGIDTYVIDPKYYLALIKNAHLGSINEIQKEMNKEWDGACYGIAATMGTLYEKLINIEDLTRDDTVTCYHDLPFPIDDYRLLNAIHTMYLSQLLKEEGGKKKAYIAHVTTGVPGFTPGLSTYLRQMYEACSKGDVVLFGYTSTKDDADYCHAIVAVGAEETDDEYLITLYDENVIYQPAIGEFRQMHIAKDFSDFSFENNKYEVTKNNYREMFICDLTKIFDLKGLYKEQMGIEKPVKAAEDSDETMTIKFASDQSIQIVNEEGKTLTYDTEQITGDFEILDADYVGSEDNVYCRIEVPKYDHLEVTGSGVIDLDAYTDDDFLAIEGSGIDQAVLDMGSGIKLSGSDYQFKAFVSTDPVSENENGLISLSGNAESDVYLRKSGTDVEVVTEGSVSDVVSESYEGVEVVKETYEHIDEDFVIAEDATIVEKEIVSSEITITSEVKEVIFGNTVQLNAAVTPADASEKITWTSSDESVAEVDENGLVTGIKPGSVTITAALNNGSSDSIDLTVLFSDVADSKQYFFNPVYWAVDNEITVGAGGPGKFSPSASCTREQFVTFLWRLKGEPEPEEGCTFSDVPESAWYYKSISWAAENGITTGLNDGTNRFGVGQACTREQCVTFLHRAADTPEPEGSIEFTDSQEGRYYYKAIKWAAGKGITVGLNDGTGRFGVGQKCTRGMLVTFLYRSVLAQ